MELLDADKIQLRALWKMPREKQRIHMILFQAIADSTELSAKEVDAVINNLDEILKEEQEEEVRKDQAR